MVSVREAVRWAGLGARAGAPRRARALFCLHAPPVLLTSELRATQELPTGEEVATDAVDFFEK